MYFEVPVTEVYEHAKRRVRERTCYFGSSQILEFSILLPIGMEISAPDVAEGTDDIECSARLACASAIGEIGFVSKQAEPS